MSADDEKKKSADEQDDGENLWTSFLATQAGTSFKEGHLVVCGSPGSGKTTLIGYFGALDREAFGDMKKFLLMRYSFAMVEDGQSLLNILQISSPAHLSVLLETVPKEQMSRLAYCIVISAKNPSVAEKEYKMWMEAITEHQSKLMERLDVDTQEALKDKVYDHVQYYINPNDTEATPATEQEKAELGLSRDNPATNIGAPVITVVTQVDAFKSLYAASDALANTFFDIFVQYVRLWSLPYAGASFSMAADFSAQASRILNYIQHRVFDTKFIHGPSAVVSVTNFKDEFLFIPSGFDSKEILEAQAGERNILEDFSTHFASAESSDMAVTKKFTAVSVDDGSFLKKLAWDLKQASDEASPDYEGKDETFDSGDATAAAGTKTAATAATGDGRSTESEAVQRLMRTLLKK